MKRIILSMFSMLILVVFFAGTTGVSFYIHECSSSQTKEITAFPELLNKTVSCCCAEEVNGSVPSDDPVSSFNEPECCKNIHIYLKASFTGFPVFNQFNQQLLPAAFPAGFLSLLSDKQNSSIINFTPIVDHPPPRSGKVLVHFLHQIKIPAPVS